MNVWAVVPVKPFNRAKSRLAGELVPEQREMLAASLLERTVRLLLPLPRDRLSSLGLASDSGGFRVTEGLKAGYYAKVTFSFTDSAPVTVETPVVSRTAEYDKVVGNEPLPTEPTSTAPAE